MGTAFGVFRMLFELFCSDKGIAVLLNERRMGTNLSETKKQDQDLAIVSVQLSQKNMSKGMWCILENSAGP